MRSIHSRHLGWDRSIAPATEVSSGEDLEFEVVDASGGQITASSSASVLAGLDFARVNPVTGPVYVRGAQPGDVLEVEVRGLWPAGWGWTGIIPGFGLLADEFPEPWLQVWGVDGAAATGIHGVRIPVRPFPGTIGVALAEPGTHSIIPPRQNGGNMDIKNLVMGSRLLLPVWVEGALFSVGDTHAAQGDGEVCGTAIECPSLVALRLTVHKGRSIAEPRYILPPGASAPSDPVGYYVTTGFSEELREAARQATRQMIDHLGAERGYTREEAYALASVAVDLRISEVVDAPHWLVSAFLPLSIFA